MNRIGFWQEPTPHHGSRTGARAGVTPIAASTARANPADRVVGSIGRTLLGGGWLPLASQRRPGWLAEGRASVGLASNHLRDGPLAAPAPRPGPAPGRGPAVLAATWPHPTPPPGATGIGPAGCEPARHNDSRGIPRIVTAPDAARRTVGPPPDLSTNHLRNRHANGDGQPTQAQKGHRPCCCTSATRRRHHPLRRLGGRRNRTPHATSRRGGPAPHQGSRRRRRRPHSGARRLSDLPSRRARIRAVSRGHGLPDACSASL